MNFTEPSKLRQQFGLTSTPLETDNKFIYVNPVISSQECLHIFTEMTTEVFEKTPNLLESTTLMVHLFPPDVINPLGTTLDKKPEGHNEFLILNDIQLETGILRLCRLNFLQFDTTYEWYYFKHKNWKYYGDIIRNKFLNSGIKPVNEWVLNYMTKGATMDTHIDALGPYVRYCFSILQPLTDTSITIGSENFYIPEGTAYLMDGDIPHSVHHKEDSPRLIMIGSLDFTMAGS